MLSALNHTFVNIINTTFGAKITRFLAVIESDTAILHLCKQLLTCATGGNFPVQLYSLCCWLFAMARVILTLIVLHLSIWNDLCSTSNSNLKGVYINSEVKCHIRATQYDKHIICKIHFNLLLKYCNITMTMTLLGGRGSRGTIRIKV